MQLLNGSLYYHLSYPLVVFVVTDILTLFQVRMRCHTCVSPVISIHSSHPWWNWEGWVNPAISIHNLYQKTQNSQTRSLRLKNTNIHTVFVLEIGPVAHCQFWDFSFTFCFSEARSPMDSWPWKKLLNDESLEVTVVISRFFFSFFKKNVKKMSKKIIKIIIASYGARLRGSVFKIKFRVLAGEFNPFRPFQDLSSF